VEIMVAVTIGLLMMAGILQISLANRESSRMQRNMGFLQENIRSSMEFLARDIRLAGHFIDDNSNDPILEGDGPAPFINVSAPTTDTTAAITADGGGANNDQITLTRESDQDCLGQSTFDAADPAEVAGNHFATNHYFVASQRLMCRGNTGAAQPLVDGVESLQILYGENTDGDSRSANRYVRADQVGNMRDVVSVRIAMRFISREAVRQSADTNQYALLDASAVPLAANDRRLRREMTTTISLRNSGL
jgi:type IV pilus assembly protein PilW